MATALKEIYSEELLQKITNSFTAVLPNFQANEFLEAVLNKQWQQMELKQRIKHIASVLKQFLSSDFAEASDQLVLFTKEFSQREEHHAGLILLFVPQYIEQNGIDSFPEAIKTIEQVTERSSCEFTVRPFFVRYPEQMMEVALRWAEHPNEHLRRLASEGSRPRLPWGMALKQFKEEPAPLLLLLEKLKNDPSEYVRRSVANNLNDIGKDHTELLINTAKQWYGESENTNKIIKHACRSLLKAGNEEIMELFGFGAPKAIAITEFKLQSDMVKMGEDLHFAFTLENQDNKEVLLRLEYAMHYLRKNGAHNQKVFKISERTYAANSQTRIERKQSFKPISTRTYYLGLHKVELLINGKAMGSLEFEVEKA